MSGENTENLTRILVVSSNKKLSSRLQAVLAESYNLTIATQWPEAARKLAQDHPALALIDSGLLAEDAVASIVELSRFSQGTRFMIIESSTGTPVDQVALFKAGVHGFCTDDVGPELLKKAVHAVCRGEIWVQRKLISLLIGELARNVQATPPEEHVQWKKESVKSLTPRELEVARMVRQGGNNKIIARKLDISERTVKAHLSSIFRKLNIDSRLHLAVFFKDIA